MPYTKKVAVFFVVLSLICEPALSLAFTEGNITVDVPEVVTEASLPTEPTSPDADVASDIETTEVQNTEVITTVEPPIEEPLSVPDVPEVVPTPDVTPLVTEPSAPEVPAVVTPLIENPGELVTDAAQLVNTLTEISNTQSLPIGIFTKFTRAVPKAASERIHAARPYVPREVLVTYNDDKINLATKSGRQAAMQFADLHDLDRQDDMRNENIAVFEITDNRSVEETVLMLERDPRVVSAQPNFIYTTAALSGNDPNNNLLWGLHNEGALINGVTGVTDADIDLPEAYASVTSPTQEVIVAVLDTGVLYTHPDLQAHMWDGSNCKNENGLVIGGCMHGYDFINDDRDPIPDDIHGSHVAGTIAAVGNNGQGVTGVAQNARIMSLMTSFNTFELVRAIKFAEQNNAKVINASFGGGSFDQALYDAIAAYPGIFVAAAGNWADDVDTEVDEFDIPFYPASYNLPNIISVAATNQSDELADFSNYGAQSVDVGAPGDNVYSTLFDVREIVAFEEYFESTTEFEIPAQWTTSPESNWGVVDYDEEVTKALFSDVETPYADNASTSITSPTIPLTNNHQYFSFYAGCDTERDENSNYTDYVVVSFTKDGVNFEDIAQFDEIDLDLDESEEGFAESYYDLLIAPTYRTNQFAFRLNWVSNDVDNDHEGCFVDDVLIYGYENGDATYDYLSGTSMAAPHVSGLAAFILGYNPNLTNAQVKQAILETGDTLPALTGKTVTGKRINAAHALQSVNPAKMILEFVIPGQINTVIDELNHTITVTVPEGTDITALTPTFTITGVGVTPVSGIAQDFTQPVVYTVTAADGSTQTYTVAVQTPPQVIVTPEPESNDGHRYGTRNKGRVSASLAQAQSLTGGTDTVRPYFTETLSFGAHGKNVMTLQQILMDAKLLDIAAPTGYFGPLTEAALKNYQMKHTNTPTGTTDEATRSRLNADVQQWIKVLELQILIMQMEHSAQ